MGEVTKWADVIANAMLFIDDVRLSQELAHDEAGYYRKMSSYLVAALPLLNKPPVLLKYLESGMVESDTYDLEWVSTEESTQEEVVLDTEIPGMDVFTCMVWMEGKDGNWGLEPYPGAMYDSETGKVTFPVQEDIGITYAIEFYKDGAFQKLTATQIRLLSLAIAVVWDARFDRTWLNMQMKIKDSYFNTINESNYIDKVDASTLQKYQMFQDELRKYEQDNAYLNAVSVTRRPRLLL